MGGRLVIPKHAGGNIVISEKVGGMLVIPINMGGKLDICRNNNNNIQQPILFPIALFAILVVPAAIPMVEATTPEPL